MVCNMGGGSNERRSKVSYLRAGVLAVVGDGVGGSVAVQILLVVHKACTRHGMSQHSYAACSTSFRRGADGCVSQRQSHDTPTDSHNTYQVPWTACNEA